jgi:hypothetical protein
LASGLPENLPWLQRNSTRPRRCADLGRLAGQRLRAGSPRTRPPEWSEGRAPPPASERPPDGLVLRTPRRTRGGSGDESPMGCPPGSDAARPSDSGRARNRAPIATATAARPSLLAARSAPNSRRLRHLADKDNTLANRRARFFGGPATTALISIELGHLWRKIQARPGHRSAVQVAICLGGDLGEPVDRRGAALLGQVAVDQMGRADVMEDVRTVFTAHQIDVVDAQVGRHGLEPRRLVGSLPLDPMRYPTPQALGGGEEGGTVGKRHPSEGPSTGSSR